MAKWHFWGEKEFSDVYENIYIRSFVEDWFRIVDKIVKEIDSQKSKHKLILDIGGGEGHTTKQILDRIKGDYVCDLLEPNQNALKSAESFLTPENNVGQCFPRRLSSFDTIKKYDVIFTSHTNYYWAYNKKDFDIQLSKLPKFLSDNGKLLILTLPENSNHYKIMLKQIYPEFNYAEYITGFYKKQGYKVEIKRMVMRIFVGDMFTTKSRFDLKNFYQFIHNTDSLPNDVESRKFLKNLKKYQKRGYLDFKDHLIIVSRK